MNRLVGVSVFALLVAAGMARAQTPPAAAPAGPPPSAQGLVELYNDAAMFSPAIKSAESGTDAAHNAKHDAVFGFLPRGELTFSHQDEEQTVVNTSNKVYQTGSGYFSNYDRTFQVVMPIVDVRIWAQLNAANAGIDRANAQAQAARQKVTYSVIEAYLLALAALDGERLAMSEANAIGSHVDEAQRRSSRGVGNQAEVDDIEGRVNKARADVTAAHNNVLKALAALNRVTGQSSTSLYPLNTSIPLAAPSPSNPEEWVGAAHKANPELMALAAGIDQSDADFEKAVGDTLPRVELFGSDDRLKAGGSLYGGGALTDQKIAEFRLTIPLFNPGGQGYTAFSANNRRQQLRYDRDDRQLDVDQRVRGAFLEAVSNASQANDLTKAAASRDNFAKDVRARFNAGTGTTIDVVDAERDAFRAQRELLSSHYNYLLNMEQLKQLTGQISADDVRFVDSLLDRSHGPLKMAQASVTK